MLPNDPHSALILAMLIAPRPASPVRSDRHGRSPLSGLRAFLTDARAAVDPAPTTPAILREYPYASR